MRFAREANMANSASPAVEDLASQIAYPAVIHGEIGGKSCTFDECSGPVELVEYLLEHGFQAGIDLIWAEPAAS